MIDSLNPVVIDSDVAAEILTRTEAAKLLRCTVSTLNRLADVPRHRVGATRRYLRSELLEYVRCKGDK